MATSRASHIVWSCLGLRLSELGQTNENLKTYKRHLALGKLCVKTENESPEGGRRVLGQGKLPKIIMNFDEEDDGDDDAAFLLFGLTQTRIFLALRFCGRNGSLKRL